MTTTFESPDTTNVNPANTLGLQERGLLMALFGPQPRLPYPTEPLKMANGRVVEKYIIPEADKADVLKQLFPFLEPPALDAVRIDIHTDKKFRIRDFLVTREGEGNFLVSPYYAEAGGTVLDWVECADGEGTDGTDSGVVVRIKTVKDTPIWATEQRFSAQERDGQA